MTVIKKWGNSLALRIPMHIAAQLNVTENSPVECSVLNGQMLVKPIVKKPKFLLRDLLEAINEENIHREISTGRPMGAEVW